MAVSVDLAREFVYANGMLMERALFGWLFDEQSLATLHAAIRAYRNPDGGYGHAMEHDIKTPESHPLALEYLLSVMVRCGVPPGDLLDGAADWMVSVAQPDGTLTNPASLHTYPHAPWWADGGQDRPTSIVGNLARLGAVTSPALDVARRWTLEHFGPSEILENEWLFMAYHAYDYYFGIEEHPMLSKCTEATVENIIACAEAAPDEQIYSFFYLAHAPDSPLTQILPPQLVDEGLSILEKTQREDGSWQDQHGLPQWFPSVTITNILVLERFGRL